jgi:topoisomerase-4 subunit B
MAPKPDLFGGAAARKPAKEALPKEPTGKGTSSEANYTAKDIEVLEGLEPVRRRPGMYIGGTDEKALHHLFAEVIDNAMDEAVAGHATVISVEMEEGGYVTVTDNGRGIPVDPHPKFPDKSALEVILTTLHSGGKFGSKAYSTSGGLHGVGVSVVNALSDHLEVEVARAQRLYRQTFSRGAPASELEDVGPVHNRRGTRVRFKPDPLIFGVSAHLKPQRVFTMTRAKAYLFAGVELRWQCAPSLLAGVDDVPEKESFRFPGGLKDYLAATVEGRPLLTEFFAGKVEAEPGPGAVEWAIGWAEDGDAFIHSYCNTIPTPDGGTHESGLRTALLRGLRSYADLTGQGKRFKDVTSEDVTAGCVSLLSVFIRDPEFQGQTKEKLSSAEAGRLVDAIIRDPFDHWLANSPAQARKLLDRVIERAEDRMRRRAEKETLRKTATRKLRLPGKLADCTQDTAAGAELFIVEGDSAGGSAKQARQRQNQAVLPLRGKILNVANAGVEKLAQNQQLADLLLALGCGTKSSYRDEDLRYEKIVIMTDADVDGAHIASLLVTYFYREMPGLIRGGHLYLAVPPLYRITHGATTVYARDDAEREKLMATTFKGKKVDIGRFKGLGEMMPAQLRETTMDPKRRTMLRVEIAEDDEIETRAAVERLMGSKADARFRFIQEHAAFAGELDV